MKYLPITELCDFQGGTQPPKKEWSEKPLEGYIRMLQIRDFTQSERTSPEYVKVSKKLKTCSSDDVLIGRYGASIGKILTGLSGAYNVAIIKTIPDEEKIIKPFLYYILNGPNFQNFIANVGARAAQAGFNKTDLAKFKVPLISLDDQKRIAHLLGKVEGLIARRKQHLQQLDDLLKSVFLEMFGPQAPGYDDWALVEIKNLAAKHKGAMRTGPFGSNLLHSEFTTEGDVAVLGIDNAVQNSFAWGERRFITNGKYQELKNYRIYPGDVIVTIMGTIGRSAVIPDDIPLAINTKHLAAITLNKELANPLFISYSIHSSPFILNQFRSKNRGAIMSGLNLGIIKETKLKRPPITLQDQFASIHRKIDEVKSKYKQSMTDLETLYGALSQKAFKGELDLSRITLPAITGNLVVELPSIKVEMHAKVETIAYELPDPGDVKILKSTEGRRELLEKWLEAYLGQLGNTPFSAQHFMETAQQKLYDLVEDETPVWGAAEYDQVKDWIFEALEQGRLTQNHDDADNRIQLKAVGK